MTSSRIARTAAVAAAGFWTLKAISIAVAGGLDKSPLESPLFLLGLLTHLVAWVALGVALTASRPWWQRVPAGLAGVFVGFSLAMAIDALGGMVRPEDPGWVWIEAPLWVSAALAILVTFVLTSLVTRARARRTSAPIDRQVPTPA